MQSIAKPQNAVAIEATVTSRHLRALRMMQFTHTGQREEGYTKTPISHKSVQTSFLIQHTPCNLFPYLKFIAINTEHEKCEMLPVQPSLWP